MGEKFNGYGASFPIARLEKRTSAKGSKYFSGYLGGARITLLKTRETGRDGCEVWHMMISEGKMWTPKTEGAKPTAEPSNSTTEGSRDAARDYQRPHNGSPPAAKKGAAHSASGPDDEIPF
jgi:hypothetical protein